MTTTDPRHRLFPARNRCGATYEGCLGRLLRGLGTLHKGLGDDLCRCANLPAPCAELRERPIRRSPPSPAPAAVHATRRSNSGVSRFSTGMAVVSATSATATRAALSLRSASGFLSAQTRGGGMLSPETLQHREVVGRVAGLDRGPPAVELRAARPAVELLERREVALGRRQQPCRRDEGGVGHEPAGRAVDLACVGIPRQPQLPGDGEVARRRGSSGCRSAAATARPARWRSRARATSRTPRRRSRTCSSRSRIAPSASRRSGEQLDVERGIDEPGLGERSGRPVRRRVLLREVDAEQLLDDGAEADPRKARRGGRPARCRTGGWDRGPPRAGRSGPGWPRG